MVIVDVWHWMPFVFLILFAAVEGLPRDVLEAARVDGATRWQIVRRIIMPLLRPAIVVAFLFRSILAFKVFDEMFLLTSGGPGTSTELVSLHLYKVFFEQNQLGYGALLSLASSRRSSRSCSRRAARPATPEARPTMLAAPGPRTSLGRLRPRCARGAVFAVVGAVRLDPARPRSSTRSRSTPGQFRFTPTLSNYTDVLFGRRSNFAGNIGNSLIVAAVSTVLVLVVGTLAAYSLHGFRWARVDLARASSAGRSSSTWSRS